MIRTFTIGRRAAWAVAIAATVAASVPAGAQTDDGMSPQRRLPPGQGAPPPPAQPQIQQKKHHNSGVGAAIGAGLVGGLVGGALLGGQRQAPPPGYAPQPAYAPPPPPPPAYEVEDEPVCRIVRKPVYDEDGEIVDYRQRRICR